MSDKFKQAMDETENEAKQADVSHYLTTAAKLHTPEKDDENELIRNRFLCRGSALLLDAASGIGKSVWAFQAAFSWTLGKTFCGLEPVRPLKITYIQAEDDEGDNAEMRDGIRHAFIMSGMSERDVDNALDAIVIANVNDKTGANFIPVLESIIQHTKPDIVIINPLFSYAGAEIAKQEQLSVFLRNQINPMLSKYRVAAIIIHHIPKPTRTENKNADLFRQYSMYGGVELVNWPRARLSIEPTQKLGVFILSAPKRGGRLRWRDEYGERTVKRFIAYSTEPGFIYWRDPDTYEIEAAMNTNGKTGKQTLKLQIQNVKRKHPEKSQREIADLLRCSLGTVNRYLKDFNPVDDDD